MLDHVVANERHIATTYEAYLPSDAAQPEGEQELLALESYVSRSEFERVHMGAEGVKQFVAEATKKDSGVMARPPQITCLTRVAGFHSRGEERGSAVRSGSGAARPHLLSVCVDLASAQQREQVLALLAPLCQYVQESEPNTLTYEVCTCSEAPLRLRILERYAALADLTQLHLQSAPFLSFVGKLKQEVGVQLLPSMMRHYTEQ